MIRQILGRILTGTRALTRSPFDALDLLRADHMKVEALLIRLRFTKNPDRRQTLFRRMEKALDEHMALEERTLYPTCETLPILTRTIEKSRSEHQLVKTALNNLEMMKPTSGRYDAMLLKLFVSLEKHIHIEEDRVFPGARHGLSPDEFARMNEQILRERQETREPPHVQKAA